MNRRCFLVMLVASSMMLACASDVRPTTSPTPRLTAAPTPTPTPLVHGHYFDDMISFEYPLEWNDGQFWHPSSVSLLKLMASTEELRPPCVQSGSAVLCRNAVVELSPGGVFVSWWRWGLDRAAPGPDPNVGELIHVGGRSARISDAGLQGKCLNMKADLTLRLEIPDPTLNGSWTVMDACLREPLDEPRAQIDEMLASIEWLGPQPTQVVPVTRGTYEYSVQVFDDTGLVTESTPSDLGPTGGDPELVVSDRSIEVRWTAGACGLQPSIGVAKDANTLLVLLEPEGGRAPKAECDAIGIPLSVVLMLSEPIGDRDVYLEVW